MSLFSLTDIPVDVQLKAHADVPHADVPRFADTLPDGRLIIVAGDVAHDAKLHHPQGENLFGFANDCGLVSCQTVLQEFGQSVSETDVVIHAVAAGECQIVSDSRGDSGGSSPESLAKLLTEMGVPAEAASDGSVESLAGRIENGHGVVIAVNAGLLWNDPNAVENGNQNHAVTVIGVAREQKTGDVAGFYINDSGRPDHPEDAGRFVSAELMEKCYIGAGGNCVVTEDARPDTRSAALTS